MLLIRVLLYVHDVRLFLFPLFNDSFDFCYSPKKYFVTLLYVYCLCMGFEADLDKNFFYKFHKKFLRFLSPPCCLSFSLSLSLSLFPLSPLQYASGRGLAG